MRVRSSRAEDEQAVESFLHAHGAGRIARRRHRDELELEAKVHPR
jgi:hypothetical protein